MLRSADVKSGEVWTSARSGSSYFDLVLDAGDLTIRLDDDGTWCVDTREIAEGGLRDFLVKQAMTRGTRGGIRKIEAPEINHHKGGGGDGER